MLVRLCLSLAATTPLVAGMMLPKTPTVRPPLRSGAVNMQYDQYGQQQGGYGQQMGGYGQQQGGGGGGGWTIFPSNGITGHQRFQAFGPQYANGYQKYTQLPYQLNFPGDEFMLGRFNMVQQSPYVSRQQVLCQILQDGTMMITACGKPATGIRSRGGQWQPLYPGQTHYVSDGDDVGLDAMNPDGAVFTFQNSGMQQGGYGGQQGMQQGGYGQQQGGYGGQQQGGYY